MPAGPPEVILDSDVAARSRDNFKDSLINCIPVLLLMGLNRFDGTNSNRLDDAVGDLRIKEAKLITATQAANDEVFALAA